MVVDIVYGKKQREDSFEPSDVCIVPPAESLKSFLFGSVPLEKLGFNMIAEIFKYRNNVLRKLLRVL